MVGILIIAHGTLGNSLIQCAQHVFSGQQLPLHQMGVTVHDDPVALLPQAQEMVRQLDRGDGVLVLTDMYGATPSNIACHLFEPGKVEGVSGVSMPMLVRALTYCHCPLATVVEKALSGGCEGVVHITTEACDATRRHSNL
ncbi:MAG: PTS sugar transporter subunit IIA [Sulfuricellaceae bacterium]